MRVETGLMNRIRAFRKEVSESSRALLPLDDTGKRQAFYEQVVPHQLFYEQDTELASTFILNFPDPRIVRNKFVS